MRYAICNETFEGWEHAKVCRTVAELGYTGLEVAPFTLAPRITDVTPQRRRELRQQAADHGLTLLGLHWLLAKTAGLQLTSPDAAVRKTAPDGRPMSQTRSWWLIGPQRPIGRVFWPCARVRFSSGR